MSSHARKHKNNTFDKQKHTNLLEENGTNTELRREWWNMLELREGSVQRP